MTMEDAEPEFEYHIAMELGARSTWYCMPICSTSNLGKFLRVCAFPWRACGIAGECGFVLPLNLTTMSHFGDIQADATPPDVTSPRWGTLNHLACAKKSV
jgi:hypothetical protein